VPDPRKFIALSALPEVHVSILICPPTRPPLRAVRSSRQVGFLVGGSVELMYMTRQLANRSHFAAFVFFDLRPGQSVVPLSVNTPPPLRYPGNPFWPFPRYTYRSPGRLGPQETVAAGPALLQLTFMLLHQGKPYRSGFAYSMFSFLYLH